MDLEKYYAILRHNVIVRKTGNRYIPIKTDCDYSKRNMISLTEDGVRLLDFVKVERSISEVFQRFGVQPSEQKPFLDYLDFLAKEGYVTLWDMEPAGKEFISNIVRTEWAPAHTPFSATIELTSRCNFNCIHCYLGDKRMDNYEMSTSQIKTIIDRLAKAGMLVLYLSGGEPLLRSDFKEIYIYARKKGMLIVLFTNGYLMDNNLLEVFLELPPLEIDISLYGSNDEKYEEITGIKGAFTKIIDNIKLFKESGITVSIKSPIMVNLADDLPELFSVAKKLDVDFRINFDIYPTLNNESRGHLKVTASKAVELYAFYSKTYRGDAETLLESIKNKGSERRKTRYACLIGKCSCFISYKGKISPCIETRNSGIDIFDENFDALWEKIGNISYNKLIDKDEKEYKCLSCRNGCICNSCPAQRERKYGSPLIVKDEDCEYTLELAEHILKEEGIVEIDFGGNRIAV